ncbi:MAG: hypothetical protein D6769_00585 [Methanobacteriota archaeon]|nr:MAG: hypothetical protein D6769_00585 [Euryarchaeota archaeon]
MKAVLNAVDDFASSFKIAAILSLPALLGILLSIVVARPTYLSFGSLFLRTSDILSMNALDFVLSLIIVVVASALLATTLILVSLLVKKGRIRTSLTQSKIRKALNTNIVPITAFYIIFFAFNFTMQTISLALPLLPIIHIISLISYAVLFFLPYALVIDDYDVFTALYKSVKLSIKAPSRIVIWLSVIFILLVLSHAILTLVLPYAIAQFLSFIVASLVILPFSIILASHLYMDRYPLS